MRQDGCELFPDTRSNAASQEFDRAQHLLVGKGRDTHLKGDSRKTSENLVHVKYPLRHLFSSRDPHAMNSDSPGESEIISTRGPQLFGTFFAKDNIKRNGDRASRKDLLSPAARLRPVIHSKFAEAAPHAVLSQVPPGSYASAVLHAVDGSNFMPTSHAAASRTGPACATSAHVAAHSRHS